MAVNLPNFGDFADPRLVADLAVAAEGAGWDGLFVWDHVLGWDGNVVGDPWVILAAVAAATERIRLGPMVAALPRRRPWIVARQAVTLDQLSEGRLVLGVGSGYPPNMEFGLFGEPTALRRRSEMLDESLAIITGMWSGEPFEFTGRHFRVGPARFLPTPVQTPRIPIWVAATWPNRGPLRRAARYDGVFPLRDVDGSPDMIDLDDLSRAVTAVATMRGGRDPFDVSAYLPVTGDTNADRAVLEAAAAAGVTWAHVSPDPAGESIAEVRSWISAGPPP